MLSAQLKSYPSRADGRTAISNTAYSQPNSISKLQEMLQDSNDTSKPLGLMMQLQMTKIMCNKHVNKDDVIVEGKKIEKVDK